ncbi:MAG: Fe-S cluster assembly sulfur transfer protein SufU [Planctomycetota bacterium]
MSELSDLYQELILDHNRSPRNRGAIENATRTASGFNPLCGDRVVLQLKIEDDQIVDAKFDGCGCAISTASASMMTDAIRGHACKDASTLSEAFRAVLTSDSDVEVDTESLGKLAALAGVRAYPTRVKCATLAWRTLEAALQDADEPVTTEGADHG